VDKGLLGVGLLFIWLVYDVFLYYVFVGVVGFCVFLA